ncbi:MAG: hypothetical protein P4L42_05410 [Desulfocapsaceae bacterium]|nr:hypothetical protein [Desulfocapsaceae bacterium]
MKITIDLDELLEAKKINQAEYDKFSRFAARSTSALAFNILVGFGVIAVSGATLALVPSLITAFVLGMAVFAGGIALAYTRFEQWQLLANICIIAGALLLGGTIIALDEGSTRSFLFVAAAFAGAGVLTQSRLLIVLSVLALFTCLGARSGYFHASYSLNVKQPALTVLVFSLFSVGVYQLSKILPVAYQGLAIVASRTGVFLVNLGFWIGSLWGDGSDQATIPSWFFSIGWAIALIAVSIWAWKANRRWVINVAAVFGSIHFYTQWFEILGPNPITVLLAGLLALGFALGLRAMNAKLARQA